MDPVTSVSAPVRRCKVRGAHNLVGGVMAMLAATFFGGRAGAQEAACGLWDMSVVESGFTPCSLAAWTNDSARLQVGEHAAFSVSRERCCRESQFCPPKDRPVVHVLSDYALSLDAQYRDDGPLVAWLVEPSEICPSCYDHVVSHSSSFDLIYTHDDALVAQLGQKGRHANWAPPSVSIVPPGEGGWEVEGRSLISFIAARKIMAEGHMMRKRALDLYGDALGDVYGGPQGMGGLPLPDKAVAVRGYMFHVVIESTQKECYISEKLTDCFVSGTIPIYRGCRRLGDFFDMGGVLPFETLEELGSILDSISPSLYESLRESAIKNYHLATGTGASSAHVIWEGGIKQLVESLPSVAVFRPTDGQVYANGEDVVLEWATRCSSGGGECATSTLLLLDDLSIASGIVGGRGTVKVGVAGGRGIEHGVHRLQLIVDCGEGEEASAIVEFLVAAPV